MEEEKAKPKRRSTSPGEGNHQEQQADQDLLQEIIFAQKLDQGRNQPIAYIGQAVCFLIFAYTFLGILQSSPI